MMAVSAREDDVYIFNFSGDSAVCGVLAFALAVPPADGVSRQSFPACFVLNVPR